MSKLDPLPVFAKRLQQLPPYLFAQIDAAKKKAIAKGKDVIDFGVGDPDLPTPKPMIEALYQGALDTANHRYPTTRGMELLRKEIARWYERRFGVVLDPADEIHSLIGSKEGIAHAPLAFLNPGDVTLVPDPCYPPYRGGTLFAGGKSYLLPLLKENHFLPDLNRLPLSVLRKAKILFLNYPNNPTGAAAPLEFLEEVIHFAKKRRIIVCYDNAYSEISYDGYKAPSFLQLKGAKEVGVEFHSLSKTYQMTGWRLGWVCGHPKVVEGIGRVKSNIDSGVFQAVQLAGIAALKLGNSFLSETNQIYQERRDLLCEGLLKIGWKVTPPKSTFYVWVPVSQGKKSAPFARKLLEKHNIVVTPGIGFGPSGEGYVRFALTVPVERIRTALSRLNSF
jgi:LL-diaminopimelate aminotransferase